jgi:hypothetical protein
VIQLLTAPKPWAAGARLWPIGGLEHPPAHAPERLHDEVTADYLGADGKTREWKGLSVSVAFGTEVARPCSAGRRKARTYEMNEVVPFPNEMIEKLIKAGYLRPEQLQDADAITSPIANMKQYLRSGSSDDNGPAAA